MIQSIKRALVAVSMVASLGVSSDGLATQVIMLEKLPASGKTTARVLVKSKKAGYQCQHVRIGENGNPVKVPNSSSTWFDESALPKEDDKSVDGLLGDGKKVVRCTLKQYDEDRNKMRNAIGDEE